MQSYDKLNYFDKGNFLNCYPLLIMIILYTTIIILCYNLFPKYFKLLWENPLSICINILNIIVSCFIFYNLCRNEIIDSTSEIRYGNKNITAMIILLYPIISFVLHIIIMYNDIETLNKELTWNRLNTILALPSAVITYNKIGPYSKDQVIEITAIFEGKFIAVGEF